MFFPNHGDVNNAITVTESPSKVYQTIAAVRLVRVTGIPKSLTLQSLTRLAIDVGAASSLEICIRRLLDTIDLWEAL